MLIGFGYGHLAMILRLVQVEKSGGLGPSECTGSRTRFIRGNYVDFTHVHLRLFRASSLDYYCLGPVVTSTTC